MDALVMCGGRGTRLDAPVEKPLFEVGGRLLVDRVLDALDGSRVETVHAAVSPHVPATRDHLDGRVSLLETPGEGYVADLGVALGELETPLLTVVSDLPLLAADAVDVVVARHDSPASVAAFVPTALKRRVGASVDHAGELVPAGVNVVDVGADNRYTSDDARLAVNVNRVEDALVAEALLDGVADTTPCRDTGDTHARGARRRGP